uniref:Secreted protein n=1 Tax=Oryza sativa subsp. japonica TaxID=39947 RepID=Q2QRU9_ORYSJ|nr:hypothetical protein LOC_Os12g26330 [Oryza sativa Japonica Group]
MRWLSRGGGGQGGPVRLGLWLHVIPALVALQREGHASTDALPHTALGMSTTWTISRFLTRRAPQSTGYCCRSHSHAMPRCHTSTAHVMTTTASERYASHT